MAATHSNRTKLITGAIVAAGSMGLAGLIGPAAVATAAPDTDPGPFVSVNGEEVTIPWPGGAWAGHNWAEGWPGGAWAGHDWSKGWPGGGFANGKAGGAWNHTADE